MNRLKYIDGLKGFACLMVFLFHFFLAGLGYPLTYIRFFSLFFEGQMCVPVFIILSAFCMTSSCKNIRSENDLQHLILKRYLRLALPTACILLVAGIIHFAGLQWNQEACVLFPECKNLATVMKDNSIFSLIKAILLSPFSICQSWLPQAWMLKFITWGSFLIIILELGTKKIKKNKRYLVCLFWLIITFMLDCFYSCSVIGFILYYYLREKQTNKYDYLISFVCFVGYCLLWYLYNQKIITYDGDIIRTILAFLLICTVIHTRIIKRFLESKIMLWLGKVSFSLYLIHYILIVSLSSFIVVSFHDIGPWILSFMNFLITIIVLLYFSWLSKTYIEDRISAKICNYILLKIES